MLLVTLLPLTLVTLFESLGRRPTLAQLVAAGLLTVATVVTNSRGSFLAIACVAGIMFLNTKKKFVYLLVAALLIPVSLAFAPKDYFDRISSIQKTNEGTAQERIDSWMIAWDVFTEHSLIGVGPKNMRFHMGNRLTTRGKNLWGREVHSLYFQLLPDFGLAGAILFLTILCTSIGGNLRAIRALRTVLAEFKLKMARGELTPELRALQREFELPLSFARALNLSWLAFLVAGTFISVLFYPPLWLLAGLSSAIQFYSSRVIGAVDRQRG
jgi:O-antigen ligase